VIPVADPSPEGARFPLFNLGLLATCVGVFLYEVTLQEGTLEALVLTYGVVPRELTSGQDSPPLLPQPWPVWTTLVTSMFLHGGWLHLAGNMLYLWVFGDNIEHALGHLKYLLFYLVCGVVAALTQVAAAPGLDVPMVGASGAIAGVLGAYLVLYPGARVTTVVMAGGPRLVPVPAAVLIGLWALLQLYAGLGTLGVETQQTGGIAHWAHIGGFICGLLLGLLAWAQRGRAVPVADKGPSAKLEHWAPGATKADISRLAHSSGSGAGRRASQGTQHAVQSLLGPQLRGRAQTLRELQARRRG